MRSDLSRDAIGAEYELARLLGTAKQTPESTNLMEDVVQKWRDRLKSEPTDAVAWCHLGRTLSTQAQQSVPQKQLDQACKLLEEAVRCQQSAVRQSPGYSLARKSWQGTAAFLVELLATADRHDEAIKHVAGIRAAHQDDWNGIWHALLVLKSQAQRIAADSKADKSRRAEWIALYDGAITSLLKGQPASVPAGVRRRTLAVQLKNISRQFANANLKSSASEAARQARLLEQDAVP